MAKLLTNTATDPNTAHFSVDPPPPAASSALAALFGPPRSGASSPVAPPFRRLELSVKDDEDQNLLDHLPECIQFIEEGRAQGAVLVHCVAGVSRRSVPLSMLEQPLHPLGTLSGSQRRPLDDWLWDYLRSQARDDA